MVEEKQLDPAKIPASGKDGRITKGDVVDYLEKPAANAAGGDKPAAKAAAGKTAAAPAAVTGAAGRQDQRVPMTRLRARIAERLLEAQHSQAQLTTFNEVDLKSVMDVRAKYKESFEKKHGVKLGFMSFFVKAAVEALKRFPTVNASIEGTDIVYHEYYDIGVAVSTEKGLMVPVLRDADLQSYADVEKNIGAYATRARTRRQDHDRRTHRRHVLDHQRRYVRIAAVDSDRQHAAKRDSRHAQDDGPARGRERRDRDPPHDVPGAVLRSPHHRRPGSRAIPRDHQGLPGRSRAAAAERLKLCRAPFAHR
jgi:hypothetical protein